MHHAISMKVLGQTHMRYVLKHISCDFGFFLNTQKQKHKSKIKCKNNKNNAYKEMQDAQIHDNEASNA